jgi:hypothetical protein
MIPEAQQPPPPSPSPDAAAASDSGRRLESTPLTGFGPSAALFNPTVGHALVRPDYRVTWFPSEPVARQPTDLGYVQNDFGLLFPVWQQDGDEWTASAHARGDIFQTHAVLPDSLRPFPDELWNIRLGTSYRHLFDNGWIAGGSVSFGSASDRPFHSIEEMTAGINTFLRVPQGEHNAWLFTLSYSPTSELVFPVPGVAFVWQPSDCFRANIGLPFQVMYRPTDDLTLDVSYMLLTTFHARAAYRIGRVFQVYGGYDAENESYFLADRADERDRFFSYYQRVVAGLRANLGAHAALDLGSGYAFERYFFQGHSLRDSHTDRIDVGDAPFLSLQLQTRW